MLPDACSTHLASQFTSTPHGMCMKLHCKNFKSWRRYRVCSSRKTGWKYCDKREVSIFAFYSLLLLLLAQESFISPLQFCMVWSCWRRKLKLCTRKKIQASSADMENFTLFTRLIINFVDVESCTLFLEINCLQYVMEKERNAEVNGKCSIKRVGMKRNGKIEESPVMRLAKCG